MESEGILPFLDVKLHHKPDGSVSTSVYYKATHTDKYLDFSSHHPLPHKRAVISTLLNRAKTHSSMSDARAFSFFALEWLPEEVDLQTLSSHIYLLSTTATMEDHDSVAVCKGCV